MQCRGEHNVGRFAAEHDICAATWAASTHRDRITDERPGLPPAALQVTVRERQEVSDG